ncbi:peptidase inhibitor family I36 protein [Glycomyces arizonensis]|uniref:peptidase inhibitor family I36 protein n=1 Tax=Glycomyces arizonensis TaxID=256035 RepID=UPI001B7FAD79|nr:peptidase inhibitor family I36 protein [Glycomyces arizonensis]
MAEPAAASARDGSCESGEFCYYYNSNNEGSVSDFTDSVSDYGTTQPSCYEFKGSGSGQGECVKNNAASVWNRSSTTVRVHFNTGYGGDYQDLPPGYKGQLNSTLYNNNASHQFLPVSSGGSSRDGSCDRGEFCYYYNSDNQGSVSDFTGSVSDYGTTQPSCYEFKGSGNGQGQCVKNNAASVWNRSDKTVRVYFNSGYGGSYQDLSPGYKGQLNGTLYNNNASHKFFTFDGGIDGARNGSCGDGEFCYYYNSYNEGSVSDFTDSVGNYGTTQPSCYEFKGSGSGQGECIKNNAASVWNRSDTTVRVYFNSYYEGSYQDIAPGYKGQLNGTLYNNNAGHRFLSGSGDGDDDGGTSGARSGTCESGEFCYYFNSGNEGSISDFTKSIGDYGTTQPSCYEFRGSGSGQGECIKNNAASVWNRSDKTVGVYFNSYYGGVCQDVEPGYKGQLNGTLYNNNASHRFLTDADDCEAGGNGGSGGGDTGGTDSEKIERVIEAALSQTGQGYSYSWAGGNKYGPTYGVCCSPGGWDDRGRFGYDCSGLTQYAFWQGAGIDIGGWTGPQQHAGTVVSMGNLRRGDMIFWGSPGGSTSHVAIYLGNGQMVEAAPPRGSYSVHVTNVYGGNFGVRVF